MRIDQIDHHVRGDGEKLPKIDRRSAIDHDYRADLMSALNKKIIGCHNIVIARHRDDLEGHKVTLEQLLDHYR